MTTRQLDNSNIRDGRYYHTKTSWTCVKCHDAEDIMAGDKLWCNCKALGNVKLGEERKSTNMAKKNEDEKNDNDNNKLMKVVDTIAYRNIALEMFQEYKYCIKLNRELPKENVYSTKDYMKQYKACKGRNNDLKKELDEKNDISKNLKGALYYWITISPPEDKDPQLLINLMEEYKKSAMFKDSYYAYIYEWREHDPPKGFHCHLLIERRSDYEPNKDKRTLNDKYKKIYKITATGISVFISGIKSEEIKDKKLLYLMGEKIDKKRDKVDNDRLLRKSYGLLDLYESSESCDD